MVTANGARTEGSAAGEGRFEERYSWETEPRSNSQDLLLGQSLDFTLRVTEISLSLQLFILKLPNPQKSWKSSTIKNNAPYTGVLRLLTPVILTFSLPFFFFSESLKVDYRHHD